MRESAWVDVREVIKALGGSVGKTESEFNEVIARMNHGQEG